MVFFNGCYYYSYKNIIADDEVVQPEENKAVKPIYKKK
jgi:hypothetical protein